MAHRTFPSALLPRVSESSFTLVKDLEVLRAVDRTVQVIPRSVGYWRGLLVLTPFGRSEDSRVLEREATAFVTSLERRTHTFDVPVFERRGTLEEGTSLTLAATPTIVGGFASIRVSGATDGLLRGQMISIGNQVFELQTDMASGLFTALPAKITGTAGAAVHWSRPLQKARLAEQGLSYGRFGPSIRGPITLPWEAEN